MPMVDFRRARPREPPLAKRKARIILRNSRSRSRSSSESGGEYIMGLRRAAGSREYNIVDTRFHATLSAMARQLQLKKNRQRAMTGSDDDGMDDIIGGMLSSTVETDGETDEMEDMPGIPEEADEEVDDEAGDPQILMEFSSIDFQKEEAMVWATDMERASSPHCGDAVMHSIETHDQMIIDISIPRVYILDPSDSHCRKIAKCFRTIDIELEPIIVSHTLLEKDLDWVRYADMVFIESTAIESNSRELFETIEAIRRAQPHMCIVLGDDLFGRRMLFDSLKDDCINDILMSPFKSENLCRIVQKHLNTKADRPHCALELPTPARPPPPSNWSYNPEGSDGYSMFDEFSCPDCRNYQVPRLDQKICFCDHDYCENCRIYFAQQRYGWQCCKCSIAQEFIGNFEQPSPADSATRICDNCFPHLRFDVEPFFETWQYVDEWYWSHRRRRGLAGYLGEHTGKELYRMVEEFEPGDS